MWVVVLCGLAIEAGSATAWTLVAGGDVMLNGIAAKSRPLSGIEKALGAGTITYTNLEIPLTTAKTATKRKSAADIKAKRQFVLKADPAHVTALAGAGIDVVSLGNNHAMDYGWTGLAEMTRTLDKAGIAWTGAGKDRAEAERLVVLEAAGGVRVGFASFLSFRSAGGLGACTPATAKAPGVATLTWTGPGHAAGLARLVAAYRTRCDLLFFALHWGIERETLPNAYQVGFARALIDAGADGVLGAHPHVLQGAEVYRGRPVIYSLGNLISPRPGQTAIYTLRWDGTEFKGMSVAPVTISGGKASPSTGKALVAARDRIHSLDRAVAKAHPQPRAKAGAPASRPGG